MEHLPRILFLVHDQQAQNLLRAALAQEGYMLQFVDWDQPLLEALAQMPSDVIILDATLPETFAWCQTMKRHPDWYALPVLLLLHDHAEATMKQGLASGVDDFLLLPAQPLEVQVRVRSMVRLTHHKAQASSAPFGTFSPKKPMLRSFIHEISNTLTSNMLMLMTAFEDEHTLSVQNAELLQQLFDRIEAHLSQGIREDVLEYLHRIDQHEETLDRVLRLVNDSNERAISRTKLVSQYAKLEYQPLKIQPLNLASELDVVLKQYQSQFHAHRIVVNIQSTFSRTIPGHPAHFQLMFEHLLKNAYEAFLAQESDQERRLDIEFSETDNTHHLTFRDNAHGISEEHLPEVFEAFYTTAPKTHAGLGLSFVAKLVAMYNGTVHLDSLPNQGTTVTLLFPISPSDSPERASEQ
jgi:signal transduction histidine kinase